MLKSLQKNIFILFLAKHNFPVTNLTYIYFCPWYKKIPVNSDRYFANYYGEILFNVFC
jgi:hypothetical protein